jgi:hypothetical protein
MPDQPIIEYFCWNPYGNSPRYRHSTQAQAEAEAERLIRQEGCSEVHILKTARVIKKALPPLEYLDCVEAPALPEPAVLDPYTDH